MAYRDITSQGTEVLWGTRAAERTLKQERDLNESIRLELGRR